MATPYVDIVDARIDADSPVPQDLSFDIRNDLRHLKERADLVGVHTLAGIHDDFTSDVLDLQTGTLGVDIWPYTWETQIDGGETLALDGAPDHYLHFTCNGVAKTVIAASPYKMRFDLDRDHQVYMEVRHKSANSDAASTWLIGFQDASLVIANDTVITTQDNIIAFVQDATAQKYKARCVKATAGVDVATALGNAANWTVLRIEVTFIGATKKVEFFVDGASVGVTPDTAKIPVVKMRPVVGFINGSGSRNHYLDYVDADWMSRPLSA